MRIIGEINHPVYKISVFKSGEKTIIQIENGHFTQQYKFNDGEIVQDIASAQSYFTSDFLENIDSIFNFMHKAKSQNSNELLNVLDVEFPEII
jgi:hypothetical protein